MEYKVNIGLRVGYVDLVGFRYNEKREKVPYIFIEVKKWGMGVDNAYPQLVSYMSNYKGVQFEIAADGNDIRIMNQSLEEMDDVPSFQIQMLMCGKVTHKHLIDSHSPF